MSIARVSFRKRFHANKINGIIINTVHDSIVCDVAKTDVEQTTRIFNECFDALPTNFQRVFGVAFNLPLKCEVAYGPNMKELIEMK